VADDLTTYLQDLGTPVELGLLGPGQPDLTAVAERVLARLGREAPAWPVHGAVHADARPGLLHGLFVGGTLCTEARLIATAALGSDACTFTDFGDDDYTRGRAHPMIDPTLRLDRLAAVAGEAGVVLMDVVLGHGAEPDPAERLAPAVAAVSGDVPVVVSVVGTAADPQGLDRQVAALADAGAEVHLSNAGAARRAVALVESAR
jgi:FdrA protein